MGQLKVGCCGFARGRELYFTQFKVVEVQQTFYKPPRPETALRWREETPQGFEFTLKAWQLITHPATSPTYRKAGLENLPEGDYGFFRPAAAVMEAWQRTEEIARALGARVIVFQCPPSFHETGENLSHMRAFFKAVGREGFLFAWEPRGNWSEGGIRALCEELGLLHCVDPLEGRSLYGEPRYFRLHGGPRYRHTYSEEELGWLAALGREGDYFLFNNITMYQDALRFRGLVEGVG